MASSVLMKHFTPDSLWDSFNVFTRDVYQSTNYPPYNVYKLKEKWYVEVAAAGFSEKELSVTYDGYTLIVSGAKKETDNSTREFSYHGIATRTFRQQFNIGKSFELADVAFVDGLLVVELTPTKTKETTPVKFSKVHPALLGAS